MSQPRLSAENGFQALEIEQVDHNELKGVKKQPKSLLEHYGIEDDDDLEGEQEGEIFSVPLVGESSGSSQPSSSPTRAQKQMILVGLVLVLFLLFGPHRAKKQESNSQGVGTGTQQQTATSNGQSYTTPPPMASDTICEKEYSNPSSWSDLRDKMKLTPKSRCRPLDQNDPLRMRKPPPTSTGSSLECRCPNPVEPVRRQTSRVWNSYFETNKAAAKSDHRALDVVLFGDSITQYFAVRQGGRSVYHDLFQSPEPSPQSVAGLALGIAGDVCPFLLYRIREGELPDNLQPSVFWVLIGTNDLGMGCSVEAVVAGNIAIVEELLAARPTAKVVINSLLPKGRAALSKNRQWQLVNRVNNLLACYVDGYASKKYVNNLNQPRVVFFNATDMFTIQEQGGTDVTGFVDYTLNSTLFRDFLHPSTDGYRLWGKAIVQKVKDLI